MTNETPQPDANIHRQSCVKITVFVDFSGEGGALITAWLEVPVRGLAEWGEPFALIRRSPSLADQNDGISDGIEAIHTTLSD
jgi:hypothetical protein